MKSRSYTRVGLRELDDLARGIYCDEGSPSAWCYAQAASRLFGQTVITDEAVLDRLREVGVCPECKSEAQPELLGAQGSCDACSTESAECTCACTCAALYVQDIECDCALCQACARRGEAA